MAHLNSSNLSEDSPSMETGSQTWRLIEEQRVIYAMEHMPGDPATFASAGLFFFYATQSFSFNRNIIGNCEI